MRPRPRRLLQVLGPLFGVPAAALLLASLVPSRRGLLGQASGAEASAAMLKEPPKIDGKRAYEYLKKICEIGPRPAGSEANARQLKLVKDHFQKMGAELIEQPFPARHPQTGERLQLTNLIGRWHPERLERVVIGAHYDTRPHPDKEVDPNRHALPFIGANDGASGVALEMEIAHHLNALDTRLGIDLVLFDGEELVFGNKPTIGKYFLGSIEFANQYARRRGSYRYVYGIVLDMVGGRTLNIPQESYSKARAPALVRQLWSVADALKAKSFKFYEGEPVLDDHLSLLGVGIPTIDIIDFNYPYWHKADDLPDKCTADSLEEVGRVVTTWLTVAAPGVGAPQKRRGNGNNASG